MNGVTDVEASTRWAAFAVDDQRGAGGGLQTHKQPGTELCTTRVYKRLREPCAWPPLQTASKCTRPRKT